RARLGKKVEYAAMCQEPDELSQRTNGRRISGQGSGDGRQLEFSSIRPTVPGHPSQKRSLVQGDVGCWANPCYDADEYNAYEVWYNFSTPIVVCLRHAQVRIRRQVLACL